MKQIHWKLTKRAKIRKTSLCPVSYFRFSSPNDNNNKFVYCCFTYYNVRSCLILFAWCTSYIIFGFLDLIWSCRRGLVVEQLTFIISALRLATYAPKCVMCADKNYFCHVWKKKTEIDRNKSFIKLFSWLVSRNQFRRTLWKWKAIFVIYQSEAPRREIAWI